MSIIIGPPVAGENFFGRQAQLSKIEKLIKQGVSVLLSGPRRVGKTSLAHRLIASLKTQDWNSIYITVEGVNDVEGFVNRMIDEMKRDLSFWGKYSSSFTKFFSEYSIDLNLGPIKLSKKQINSSDSILLEALRKSIQNFTGNVFIVIDELPIFLKNMEKKDNSTQRVSQVLECLRAMRQTSTQGNKNTISFLYSGSISLEHYAADRQLSYAINDLQSNILSSFTDVEAKLYIDYLVQKNQLHIASESKDHILHKVKWPIPYYINIIIDELLDLSKSEPITIEDIDSAYSNGRIKYKKDFDFQIQRLSKDNPNADLYIFILKTVAKLSQSTIDDIKAHIINTEWKNTKEEELFNILDLLEHDGYLVRTEDIYTYRSPFLYDYIKDKYHL
jgi:uncharacterized protein